MLFQRFDLYEGAVAEREIRDLPVDRIRTALFEFDSILVLLRESIDILRSIKGIRSKLAEAARCQPSYLSQVLAGTASLSTEQLFGIAKVLQLSDAEWDYVRELGMLDRAGTEELREDCKRRLLRLRQAGRSSAPNQSPASNTGAPPNPKSLSSEDLTWYVSTWQISALMAAVASPNFRTASSLSTCLRIPLPRINELISQLIQRKMLEKDGKGNLKSSLPKTMFLGSDAAGQIFRMGWLQHGSSRAFAGYRDGFQRGGVFRGSRREFQTLKDDITALHRNFFATDRDPNAAEIIGFFGVELFEA